jgi:hypothetical protein
MILMFVLVSSFIDSVVYHDKSDYTNKRHLLVCDNCYWCLSYLPDLESDDIEFFNDCPKCDGTIKSMYISEKAATQ